MTTAPTSMAIPPRMIRRRVPSPVSPSRRLTRAGRVEAPRSVPVPETAPAAGAGAGFVPAAPRSAVELVVSWPGRMSGAPTGTGAPGTTADGASDVTVAGAGEEALRAAGGEPAGPDPGPVGDGPGATPEPERAAGVSGGDVPGAGAPVGRTRRVVAVVGELDGEVLGGGAAVVVVTGSVVVVVARLVVVDGRVVLVVALGAVVAVVAVVPV